MKLTVSELRSLVETYLERFPESCDNLKLLLEQLASQERLDDRSNFTGHVTAAGVVLSPDRQRILLIHHKLFDKWLQPGGHWEPDTEATPLEAARREVTEETGVSALEYLPLDPTQPLVPIDIDTHHVTGSRKRHEPPHYHHDFRYVFIAGDDELVHQAEEVNAAAWFGFDAPETEHVRRLLEKARRLKLL